MSFCRYGSEKKVGKGIYYICSQTGHPCKFARWCSSENKYKPNANFHSCNVRTRTVEQPPVVEEITPVIEEAVEVREVSVSKEPQDDVIEELFETSETPKRRRKKRVVEEPTEILDEIESE